MMAQLKQYLDSLSSHQLEKKLSNLDPPDKTFWIRACFTESVMLYVFRLDTPPDTGQPLRGSRYDTVPPVYKKHVSR